MVINTGIKKVRIAIDAMGGDFAPENQILGTINAAREKSDNLELTLVGKSDLINEILKKKSAKLSNIIVVNAEDEVTMNDSPSESFKNKPNSSLNIALELQKQNLSDAFISAGNTGAVLANSTLKLGRITGVSRPTIGSLFPTMSGLTMVFDVGASVDCRAKHLLEFAVMGSVYMNYIYKIVKPRVALLSVGEEKTKGNELTLSSFELLEKSNLNFIGNVEGSDVLKGKADVIVCDGFIGNIILKFAESILDILKHKFLKYAQENILKKFWIGLIYNTLKKVTKDFDYQNYGGVPLLGIKGVSIVGHGKSSPLAIKNMIYRAEEFVINRVNFHIETAMSQLV